jgi:hypothetical protein
MKLFISVCLVTLFAITGSVNAESFDVAGAACVPDSSAVFGRLYANASGGVGHASGVTATVALNCSIPNASAIDNDVPSRTLKILYTDNSAVSGNQVVVSLYKMNKTTAALGIVATVNSDNCSQAGTASCASSFTETLDSANFIYFLGVYIARNSTANTEIFWGASVF